MKFYIQEVFASIFFSILGFYLFFKKLIDKSLFFNGELALIEISQIIILSYTIFILIKNKKLFYKAYNKIIINLKIAFFLFLIYEELSFLTSNRLDFFQSINNQSEINLHNLYAWDFIKFNIPFLGEVGPVTVIISSFLISIGILRYLSIPKYLYAFSLEKFLFPYTFIYLFNLLFSRLLSNYSYFFYMNSRFIIMPELTEFLLYLIFCFDTVDKLKKIKFNNKKKIGEKI